MIYKKLEEVVECIIDYRGKTPKKSNKGIKMLSAKTVKMGYIDYDNAYCISQEEFNKFNVRGEIKKGDVLVTTEAPLGCIARLTRDDVGIAQRLLALRGKKNILNNDYLMYYLMSKEGQHELLSRETGTTVTGIKQSEIRKIIIPVIDLNIQEKLSKILINLDKKIELNNKINDNLQELARCQYNEYFGSKANNAKLKDLVNFKKKIVKSSNKNPDLGYYPIDMLPMNYLVIKSSKPNEEANSSLIEFSKYDILLGSMRVYFHRVCLASNSGITRNTTFVFEPKLREQLYYSLLLIDRNEFIEYANRTSKGSTMPYAVWEALAEYDIYLPTLEESKIFYEWMYPVFEKMISNESENRTLEQLRDTLLPKLMNGEIDLENIEI